MAGLAGRINYNLLNQNAPAQVGAAFNPLGAYQQGRNTGEDRFNSQQLNALALQKAQRIEQEAPAIAAQKQQEFETKQKSAQIEQATKMNTLRMDGANEIASAPDGNVLQTAFMVVDRTVGLSGGTPEQAAQAKAQLQAAHDKGGEPALREEARKQSLDAGQKLAQINQEEQRKVQMRGQDISAANAEKRASSPETYSPSPLKKLIDERQALVDSGVNPNDPRLLAYDSKISGTEIDVTNITQDEIDVWGSFVALTGKMPSLGRGKASTKTRLAIAKSAAVYTLGGDKTLGESPDKTPSEAALSMLTKQSDTKSTQGSLNFLEKQVSAMGSFVTNIGLQVDKVKELSTDLETYDSRIMNVPLRFVRGKILGSPLQAKYDMYLTEIESEIGKLATGSAASIAELSTSAQEKWANIHDKNLSVKDMISLLEETSNAADMRLKSVEQSLGDARTRMANRKEATPTSQPKTIGRFQVEVE